LSLGRPSTEIRDQAERGIQIEMGKEWIQMEESASGQIKGDFVAVLSIL